VKKFSSSLPVLAKDIQCARGIRDALRQIAPDSAVESRDLFADAFGRLNEIARRAYLVRDQSRTACLVGHLFLDRSTPGFRSGMRWFRRVRQRLSEIIERDRPDVIVSVYPPYPHLLDELCGPANGSKPRRIVCVTDSITINSICIVVRPIISSSRMIRPPMCSPAPDNRALMRVFGFPVNPRFADVAGRQIRLSGPPWRILPNDKRRPKFRLRY